MASDFSRTLALLRREKRISQRTAAADLQVSQALLSHYENGLREPGLAFVVRAAEYYGVSCDYLLGRSMSRDNGLLPPQTSTEAEPADAITTMYQKLISDSAALLLDAASRSGSPELVRELSTYLSAVCYKLFRYLYQADPTNPPEAFKAAPERFDALCDALMKLSELRIRCTAAEGEVVRPELSLGTLSEQFPDTAQSMLTILQNTSDEIQELGARKK